MRKRVARCSAFLPCLVGSHLMFWGSGLSGLHFIALNAGVFLVAVSAFRLMREIEGGPAALPGPKGGE